MDFGKSHWRATAVLFPSFLSAKVESQPPPEPSPSATNSRNNLEASLSDALNKLLSQRRQYLSDDEDGEDDSF